MESNNSNPQPLQLSANMSLDFWTELRRRKLEEWKLDDKPQTIFAKYKVRNFDDTGKANLLFDSESFVERENEVNLQSGSIEVKLRGELKVFNTIEQFRKVNLKGLQEQMERDMTKQLTDTSCVNALNSFRLLMFGDLKKFTYKFLLLAPNCKVSEWEFQNITDVRNYFSSQQVFEEFDDCLRVFPAIKYTLLSQQLEQEQLKWAQYTYPGFYYGVKVNNPQENEQPFCFFENIADQRLVDCLSGKSQQKYYFVMIDANNQPGYYSKFLQNYLAFLLTFCNQNKFKLKTIELVILKDFLPKIAENPINYEKSLVVTINLEDAEIIYGENKCVCFEDFPTTKNVKTLDLKSNMDEELLASNAVDLNIKLIKWRLLPQLDYQKIKEQKVLLIGAGTLGSQVSRNLIAWGVRNITFIDYGKVSHSNPVRQSLYNFIDAKDGGQYKAPTAAKSLKNIFPGLITKGLHMEIPMPGHYLENKHTEEYIKETLDTLEEEVSQADAVFLLTDSRESRWLMTVLTQKYNKICISVGLGFDSFVVIRHGANAKSYQDLKNRVGCYFCNDIISPQNTLRDRTLDQQCTVTKPGLSFTSSAYAVELYISLLHHPLGLAVGASADKNNLDQTCIGILPQHIRGDMGRFQNQLYYGLAFEHCVACSQFVLDEYLKNRDAFIIMLLKDPEYMQKVSQIEALLELDPDDIIMISDTDEEENEEEEKEDVIVESNNNEEGNDQGELVIQKEEVEETKQDEQEEIKEDQQEDEQENQDLKNEQQQEEK